MKRLTITILMSAALLLSISACQRSASTAPEGVGQPTSVVPENNLGVQPTLPPIEFPLEVTATPEPIVLPTEQPAIVTPDTSSETAKPEIVTVEGMPASYTLQKGEFPFCIARRYNVDPFELLDLNGLALDQIFYAGRVLVMPTSGAPFPTTLALHFHTPTYTVTSSEETLRTIACYFGDVDPAALATANGLASADAPLTIGMVLTIP
jgi:LysM repeat protein